jgi:hypothetical protein
MSNNMPYLNKDQNKIQPPLGELSSEGMGLPFTTGIAFATMRDGSSSKKISEEDGHTLSKQAKKLNKQGFCIKGVVSQNKESQVISLGIDGSLSDLIDITKELPVEPTISYQVGNNKFVLIFIICKSSEKKSNLIINRLKDDYEDFTISKPNKLLLPNFKNHQSKGFQVAIISSNEDRITAEDFIDAFGYEYWEEPTSLDLSQNALEPLSTNILPSLGRKFVNEGVQTINCASEFIAIPLIILISSLIGHKIHIQPTSDKQHLITVVLWGMLIGEPGTKKTPASMFAMRLLDVLIENADKEYLKKIKRSEAKKDIDGILYKLALKQSTEYLKQATETNNEQRQRALVSKAEKALHQVADKRVTLTKKRYKTSNATFSALHKVMLENPNGLLLSIDEIIGLLSILHRKGNEETKAYILECFSGWGSFDVDRATTNHKPGRNMALSIFGTIQPDKLFIFLKKVLTSGLDNDGFLARFQLLVSLQYPVKMNSKRHVVDQKIIDNMQGFIVALNNHGFGFEDKPLKERVVKFTFDAEQAYQDWWFDFSNKYENEKTHPVFDGHMRKYDSLVASLALIFEVISAYDYSSESIAPIGEVTIKSLNRAIAFTTFLEGHAKVIFNPSQNLAHTNAMTIDAKLADLPEKFTVRDIAQRNLAGINRSSDLTQEALNVLITHHRVKKLTHDYSSKTQRYQANPKLISM